MNFRRINKLSLLEECLMYPLYLSNNKEKLQKEMAQNWWAFDLVRKLREKTTVGDLSLFVEKLLEECSKQVAQKQIPAIFYLWYDAQASQLCFNIISAVNKRPPFYRMFNQFSDYRPILEGYLKIMEERDNTKFIVEEYVHNPDEDDDDDEFFPQDVFVTHLK